MQYVRPEPVEGQISKGVYSWNTFGPRIGIGACPEPVEGQDRGIPWAWKNPYAIRTLQPKGSSL